jgi:DNA helicase-2/ATP-dependent DNA helicase PcrA
VTLFDDLNPPQREAVLTTEGPVLVLAGAGSGKTRVLTYRVAHLVHGLGVESRNILAFTFTNKAAGEMKGRVSYLLGGSPRDLWVGTFHATGVRILRQSGEAIGIDRAFVIYDTDDQEALIRRILRDLDLADRDLSPKAIRSRISEAKNALLTPAEFAASAQGYRAERVARIYTEYQTRLRAHRALDFDDLIGETLRLLSERPEIGRRFADRFRYVLVDEYQDTNAAQERLIRALASVHRNLCVVGDDDQSIYGWRGADVGNILSFESQYPEATVIRLEQNYRSTGNILAAANAVVRQNRARKEKTLWTERGAGDLLTLTVTGNEEEEADRVVATVMREVNRKGVPLCETAVLYRTNAQSRALETAFRRAAIAYELVGGVAFYQRREVKDLLAYLRLLVNSEDDLSFARVLNVPRRGIGATTLDRLAEHARREGKSLDRSLDTVEFSPDFNASARQKLGEFRRLIEDLRARLAEPVDAVLKELVERTRYLEFLEADDPESVHERMENVEELVVGARAFTERNEAKDAVSFLSEVALLTDIDRTEEGAEKIRLMTMHNAKGLEFRTVCVAGLEEGLLPHASSQETDDDLEEERRLFYVALTRGKDRVHLFAASTRARWGGTMSAPLSRFVEEIPPEFLEVEALPKPPAHFGPPRRERAGLAAPHAAFASGPRRILGTVIHPTFGRGDVVDREGTGPEARLTVIFAGNLKKKIVARYAEWEESHVDF